MIKYNSFYDRVFTCLHNSSLRLNQCFSKWVESPPWGDFEEQGGEKSIGGDRGAKRTKGAKMINH